MINMGYVFLFVLWFQMEIRKMAKKLSIPAPVEMRILFVLWKEGPCTVRQARKYMGITDNDRAYTSTLKPMQNMLKKGLVTCDKVDTVNVYRAAVDQARVLKMAARRMLDDTFGGSLENLVMAVLRARKWDKQQLEMVRAMVEEAMDSSN